LRQEEGRNGEGEEWVYKGKKRGRCLEYKLEG